MRKKRRSLKTTAIAKRRRRLFFIKIGAGAGLLVAVFLFFVYLSGREAFLIQNISVSGNEAVSTNDVERIASETLEGNNFSLFPRRNFLWYPKEEILENIDNAFSRVSNVNIRRESFRDIQIVVEEREPEYTWCGVEPLANESAERETCYFLDETGYVFSRASNFSGNVYVKFYGPLSDTPVQDLSRRSLEAGDESASEELGSITGKYYLNAEAFSTIFSMIQGIEDLSVEVESVRWQGGQTAILETDYGFRVRFRLSDEPENVLENLRAVLGTSTFQNADGEERLQDVEYFDLRFGNRVFYK